MIYNGIREVEKISEYKKNGGDKVAKLEISISAARENAQLTQLDVAKKLGVTKQTIVNWEKYRQTPSVKQAKELSLIFGIPLDNIRF